MAKLSRRYDDLLWTLDYKYDLDRIFNWCAVLSIIISVAAIVVAVTFNG